MSTHQDEHLPVQVNRRIAQSIAQESAPIDFAFLAQGARTLIQNKKDEEVRQLRKLALDTALLLGQHTRPMKRKSAWAELQK